MVYILRDVLPALNLRDRHLTKEAYEFWDGFKSVVCRQLGVEILEPGAGNAKEECESFIRKHPSVDKVLGLIELAFRVVEKRSSSDYGPFRGLHDPDDATLFVIGQRDPDSGELIPQVRRGVKRQVERGKEGIWRLVQN